MSWGLAARALVGLAGYAAATQALSTRFNLIHDVPTRSVRTADGEILDVAEYPGPGRRGVIYLQHGLAANLRSFDLHPHGPSFARWLAAQGYKVYAGNLRGRSRKNKKVWTFSDHLLRDIPALAAHIGGRRKRPFHWVGHSLGGILGLAYAGGEGRDRLLSVTTIGSSFHYAAGPSNFKALLPFKSLLEKFSGFPLRRLHRLMGPLSAGWIVPDSFHYNRRNMSGAAVMAYHSQCVCDVTVTELLELASGLEENGLLCEELGDRLEDIARSLDVPWLSFAGGADKQCPPSCARKTFDGIEAPAKKFILASREEGFLSDYGHYDLIAGEKAESEVWPRIRDFIADAQSSAKRH